MINSRMHVVQPPVANLSPLKKSMSMTEQVSADLQHFLSSAKDRQKGLSLISRKIGVHTKTLNRIILTENSPTY